MPQNYESLFSPGKQGVEAGAALFAITPSDQLGENLSPVINIRGLCEFKAFPWRELFDLGKAKNSIEL